MSRQLISDALIRKGSIKDANSEYVQRLRVSPDASDSEIQTALHRLFSQGSQGQSVKDPQGRSVSSNDQAQCSPGNISSESKPSIIAATSVSKMQLDNSFRNSLCSLLQQEVPYSERIQELESGGTNVRKNDEMCNMLNGVLLIHQTRQDAELDYWRIEVPDNRKIRDKVVQELHSIPYSAHRGI